MRDHFVIATIYVQHYAQCAKQVVVNTKDQAVENKREIAILTGTAVVVGVAARVAGFKAGYKFAQNN